MFPSSSSTAVLGPAVTLAVRAADGSCSCGLRAECARPGAHPLFDRWWTDDPTWGWSQWGLEHAPAGSPGVLVPLGRAVLQVPLRLRLALVHHCAEALLTPPMVHTAQRSWVWMHADARTAQPVIRPFLPSPAALVVLGPGAWIPVPPTALPDESPLRWGGPPGADPLSARDLDRLLARFAAVRPRPAQDTP